MAVEITEVASVVAPLATFVVASVALFVGLRTIGQRDRADRREQWWARFRWASDLTLGPDEHQRRLGLEMLELLAASRLAAAEELDLLDAAMTAELSRRPDLLDDDDGVLDGDGGQEHHEGQPHDEPHDGPHDQQDEVDRPRSEHGE